MIGRNFFVKKILNTMQKLHLEKNCKKY